MTKLPERNLDVLRATAVLCVLFSHVAVLRHWRFGIITPYELGYDGVLLFFVHTSLVLMGSLERQGERSDWVKAFYVRRAWRIYPLSIATVLLVAIVAVPAMPQRVFHAATSFQILANIALAQNVVGVPSILGPFWSLPLEMQMYFLLPLLYVAGRRTSKGGLAVLWATGALVGLAQIYGQPRLPVAWRLNVLAYAPCFVAGIMAYRLCAITKARIEAWVWPIAIGCLLAIYPEFISDVQRAPARGWLLCLAIALLIPAVREMPASRITALSGVIAKYSYGIYLLHIPALWFSFIVLSSSPAYVQWSVFAALVVALPWLAYTMIEDPGIRIGRRVAQRGTIFKAANVAP